MIVRKRREKEKSQPKELTFKEFQQVMKMANQCLKEEYKKRRLRNN